MSDVLVERVAEAICEAADDDVWADYSPDHQYCDEWRKEARDVLRAVEEAGFAVVPVEMTDVMATAYRQALRDGGLLAAYDEPKGAAELEEPPILNHLLKEGWSHVLAAARQEDPAHG